ncbi:MAG: chondroitinase-B domain-containing protein [Myxococcota bacterium]
MRIRGIGILIATHFSTTAWARDVPVTNATELLAAVQSAQPGDVILLSAGDYDLGNVTCSVSGTATEPIVVRSVPARAAHVRFSGLEGFRVQGAHWHFEDLHISGVCPTDDDCEHAFHVTGAADGFVLRGSRVEDFNAQLKVNAANVDGTWRTPNNGLIEGNDLGDTRPRSTSNPVTKLNIDTGDDWIVRANILHDFHKDGGNGISYGAFMKSGGQRGIFERNLVLCTRDVDTGGTRIGLSFGGGGTAPQYCAPAFDAQVPCNVEHRDGIMRNNIIANCSDVGIYLNRAANSRILHNTLVATSGVDFRFDTTTGEAAGNVHTGQIRNRDGATHTAANNLQVDESTFTTWYPAPLVGDLRPTGDVSSLVGAAPAHALVTDDYCARARPSSSVTLGALEHSLGSCDTLVPPLRGELPDAGPMDAAVSPGPDGGPTADASTPRDSGTPPSDSGAIPPDAAVATTPDSGAVLPDASVALTSDGGDSGSPATPRCACATPSAGAPTGMLVLCVAWRFRRRLTSA